VDESSIVRFPLLKPVPKHARLPSSLYGSRVHDFITTSSSSIAAARALADAHAHDEAPRLEYFARKEDVAPIGGLPESKASLNATAMRSAERRSMPVSIVIHDLSNVMISKPMHCRPTISPVFFPAHHMMKQAELGSAGQQHLHIAPRGPGSFSEFIWQVYVKKPFFNLSSPVLV
jgi:hypothetical protein